jgi:hypothetical protein
MLLNRFALVCIRHEAECKHCPWEYDFRGFRRRQQRSGEEVTPILGQPQPRQAFGYRPSIRQSWFCILLQPGWMSRQSVDGPEVACAGVSVRMIVMLIPEVRSLSTVKFTLLLEFGGFEHFCKLSEKNVNIVKRPSRTCFLKLTERLLLRVVVAIRPFITLSKDENPTSTTDQDCDPKRT